MTRTILCLLAVGLGLFAWPAFAEVQQAPGSRVKIDLPAGFSPAKAYSGFENEALQTSFVVVEMPAIAFDQLKSGFTAEALAAKGIVKAAFKSLSRPDDHLYMTGEQMSAMGDIAKFMLVVRGTDSMALITGNVPKATLASGKLTVAAIEAALTGATLAAAVEPAKPLFKLGDLGAFKSAGSFAGTTQAYTLDGSLAPPPGADRKRRELFLVAPSLDARPVGDLDAFSRKAVASLAGTKDVVVAKTEPVTIAGLTGLAAIASAKDKDDGAPLQIYHVVLVKPAGGYYRLVGMTFNADPALRMAEFRRIAASFQPLP
jgi:hypothetical protein